MSIKVIVELQAKPGRRGDLQSLIEGIAAKHGPSQRGYLGSTRYEVPDNPDILVEIAEWESAEARMSHMHEAAAAGVIVVAATIVIATFALRRVSEVFKGEV